MLIMMGSAIFVSSGILHIRKQVFERKLQDLADHRKNHRSRSSTLPFSRSKGRNGENSIVSSRPPANTLRRRLPVDQAIPDVDQDMREMHEEENESARDDSDKDEPNVPSSRTRIRFANDTNSPSAPEQSTGIYARRPSLTRVFSNTGVGAHSLYNHPRATMPSTGTYSRPNSTQQPDQSRLNKYVDSLNGYIGRNSQFHNLTHEERKQLGGIEYDSLCLLSWLVPTYFVLFQLFGAIGCGAWLYINRPSLAYENGMCGSSHRGSLLTC